MGGRGASGKGKSGGGGGAVSINQAEKIVMDTAGFGKDSRIKSAEVTNVNPDGTVNMKFKFNTTPAPGRYDSVDKTVYVKKVKAGGK